MKCSVRGLVGMDPKWEQERAILASLRCGAGDLSAFFIKHLEKEGTLGQSPGPGCLACLSHHTPSQQSPFLGETGSPRQAV